MDGLKIREMILKPGRPKVAVPLVSCAPAEIIEECEKAMELPCDMIEWRVDYYLSAIEDIDGYLSDKHGYLDMVKILDDINYIAADKPLIFAVRSEAQGGKVSLTGAQKESLYGLAAEAGLVDFIDIELKDNEGDIPEEWIRQQIEEAHEHGVKVILSHHEFERMPTPVQMAEMAVKMSALGADVFKIAAMASDKTDAENLLKTAAFLTKKGLGPMIMLAMGDAGKVTRVAGGRYGSCVTFASGKETSAPGQVDTYTMKKWLDDYYGE